MSQTFLLVLQKLRGISGKLFRERWTLVYRTDNRENFAAVTAALDACGIVYRQSISTRETRAPMQMLGEENPRSPQLPGLKAWYSDPGIELYAVETRTEKAAAALEAIRSIG